MGPKLTDLATLNVPLSGFRWTNYEDLLSSCSIYLVQPGRKVWASSLHALENGQVLFGLRLPCHEAYKNLSTITETVEEMEQQLNIAPASRDLQR